MGHQHGRRFIVWGTNMAAVTSCENTLIPDGFQYVTLHFRDQRGAASVRYRNLAEITVLPSLETRAWEQLENSLLWFYFLSFTFSTVPQ